VPEVDAAAVQDRGVVAGGSDDPKADPPPRPPAGRKEQVLISAGERRRAVQTKPERRPPAGDRVRNQGCHPRRAAVDVARVARHGELRAVRRPNAAIDLRCPHQPAPRSPRREQPYGGLAPDEHATVAGGDVAPGAHRELIPTGTPADHPRVVKPRDLVAVAPVGASDPQPGRVAGVARCDVGQPASVGGEGRRGRPVAGVARDPAQAAGAVEHPQRSARYEREVALVRERPGVDGRAGRREDDGGGRPGGFGFPGSRERNQCEGDGGGSHERRGAGAAVTKLPRPRVLDHACVERAERRWLDGQRHRRRRPH
jgi:hypothetical protein